MSKNTATIEKPEKEQAEQKPALTRPGPTYGQRFLADVEKQFVAQMGQGTQFTALERRLVQHMYLAVDQALKASEAKRTGDGTPYDWHGIDREKLALDTVHRVSLGLDALVPGHLWPIFYWNSHKRIYDVDLRIGYVGRDFVTRKFAVDSPVAIVYELVHETDHFKALPKSSTREVEGYEFEISSPFDRGEVVGGFGYVVYDDPRKNRLYLVTPRDFERAKKAAKTKDFWTANEHEMKLKTIYHRVASKLPLDPAKVNAEVLASVLEDDQDPITVAAAETSAAARANANGQVLTLDSKHSAETIDVQPAAEREPEPEPVRATQPSAGNGQLFGVKDADLEDEDLPY